MGSHQSEGFHLAVTKSEYLHDADGLGTRIITSEAGYFYQVELVVIKACLLHLII